MSVVCEPMNELSLEVEAQLECFESGVILKFY